VAALSAAKATAILFITAISAVILHRNLLPYISAWFFSGSNTEKGKYERF
jgi:hypothetical protein